MFNPLDHPACLAQPARPGPSPWLRHLPFAMFLVDAHRPEVLVELGTVDGVSYCGFCQAIRELGLGTRCVAVDAGRAGGPDDWRGHHDALYGDFSRIVPGPPASALARFADGSIDLLHVHEGLDDGEGLGPWLGKLSRRGIVLVDGEEVRAGHPHFASYHQHGLVVLAVGEPGPGPLRELLGEPDGPAATRARHFFFRLGQGLRAALERDEASLALRERDERRRDELDRRERELARLEREARRASDLAAERERTIRGLVAELAEKERAVLDLRPRLAEAEHRLLVARGPGRSGPSAWLRSRAERPWRLARRGLGVWRREGLRSLVRKTQQKLDKAWRRGR